MAYHEKRDFVQAVVVLAAEKKTCIRALQKFVRMFEKYSGRWNDEFRGEPEFLDFREAYDAACEALKAVNADKVLL